MRKINDEERIENYFTTADPKAAAVMLEKIQLIMRVRQVPGTVPAKVGRPRKTKAKPEPVAEVANG